MCQGGGTLSKKETLAVEKEKKNKLETEIKFNTTDSTSTRITRRLTH